MFEIEREEQQLLPGYYEAKTRLSKKVLACVCNGIGGTSLDDNIVALALTINGQQ